MIESSDAQKVETNVGMGRGTRHRSPVHLVERTEEILCVVLTLALLVSVCLQVFFRYVLHSPLIWTDELARYCVVWLTFIGAALTSARGGHIAIELGDRMLGRSGIKAVAAFAGFAVVAACVVMIAGADGPILQTARRSSVALGMPLWVLTIAAPAGFALMGVHTLIAAVSVLRDKRVNDRSAAMRGMI